MTDGLLVAEQDLVRLLSQSADPCLDLSKAPSQEIRGTVLARILAEHSSQVTRLTLSHVTVTGQLDAGGATLGALLRFTRVTFDEPPVLSDAHLQGLSLVACVLPGLEMSGTAVEHAFSIIDSSVTGCFRLSNARLGGGLRIANTTVASDGVAVAADWVRAEGGLALESTCIRGTVSLIGAAVEGHLNLDDADIDGRGQYALNAKLARIEGNLYLRRARVRGELRLGHVAINGDLDLRGAAVDQDQSLGAVSADSARIVGRVRLSDGFSAQGEVSLVAAHIRDIDAASAHLSARHRAVYLDRADIVNDVTLHEGFEARGEVSLCDTQVGGALVVDHAALKVDNPASMPCLRADNATVAGNVILAATTLVGGVRLPGATIGQLVLTDLSVERPNSTAVSLRHVQIRTRLLMRNTRIDGLFDVREAHMNDLDDTVAAWRGVDRLDLDGLTYEALATAGWSVGERLAWVRRSQAQARESRTFGSGPYEQLARTYRARGENLMATRVLMARENDRLKAERPAGPAAATRHLARYALKILVGHGYRPGRAVWYLISIILLYGLFLSLGPNHIHAMISVDGLPRSQFNPVLYAADTVLPVVDLGESDHWRPDPDQPWGPIYRGLTVAAVITGWVLSTALVAALARLSRSD